MCGPGQEMFLENIEKEEEANERLAKHMDNLKVLTNDALFYHKEKQWVMLERTNRAINTTTKLIEGNLDNYERIVE